MSGPSRSEREAARVAAEVTRRAIRRLDVLEWVMFIAALVLAVLGGAGVAWLLGSPEEPGFRITWGVSALLLFVIPGAIVIVQTRRSERAERRDEPRDAEGDDG